MPDLNAESLLGHWQTWHLDVLIGFPAGMTWFDNRQFGPVRQKDRKKRVIILSKYVEYVLFPGGLRIMSHTIQRL